MRQALNIGKAAEHLVCADLLLQGVPAYLSDQGLPFDVLALWNDRLIRIQVKATQSPRNINSTRRSVSMAYSFNVRHRGKGNKGERLSAAHCDLVALVALDIRQIAYLPLALCSTTIGLHPPGHEFPKRYNRAFDQTIDQFPFIKAIS